MQQVNWLTYQYQILRYEHDAVTGEFANLGLVYFDPATGTLLWRFEDKKYGRLSHFFGEKLQGPFMLSALKQLGKALQKLKNAGLQNFQGVEEITKTILPPDDNGWGFSNLRNGRHFDHVLNFEQLYDRIIGRYQEEATNRRDDAYVWKNVYKKHFDRYGLTPKLQPQRVETGNDSIPFQQTCQNGVLHCFQSLSFDLKHESTIKDKIYKWDGVARELLTAQTPMKVYLLSLFPENPELADLLRKKLTVADANVEIRVVDESEVDLLAQELKTALESPEHQQH